MAKEKSPALGGSSGPGSATSTSTNFAPAPRKWQRVLRAFINGASLNRFDAERKLGDHTLPSTVAALQARGITIARRAEVVRGYAGCATRVMRYAIDRQRENIARAVASLERDTARRRRARAERVGEHHREPVDVQAGR